MSARRRRAGKDILIVYCLLKLTEKKGRKEMRRMKWLLAAVLSLALMFAMGSTVFAADGDSTELEITNNTGMFKAVSASLENNDGNTVLKMALSGTGYHEIYKGTYEEAVANGDNTDNWVHGYQNADGKWEFQITIAPDETYIPIVAISDSYYTKYLNGQNALERAFYPRQVEVNAEAKTLVTGDYDETTDFTIISKVKDFKVKGKASTEVVGGPNSNNYTVAPTLVMRDATYDKVTYPTVEGNQISTAEATLTDGCFAIEMKNAPNKEAFKDKTPIEMTFHVAENSSYDEAGQNVTRMVTIDKMAKTITIEGDPLTGIGDGTYMLPELAAGPSAMFNHFMGQSKKVIISGDTAKICFTTDGSTGSIQKYSKIALGKSSELLTENYQQDLPEGTTVIEGILQDDGTDTKKYAFEISMTKSEIAELLNNNVAEDIYITIWNSEGNSTDKIPGWYKPNSDIYLSLGQLGEEPADYSAVEEAKSKVPKDLSIYTDETKQAVEDALNAVVEGKPISEQAAVDAMAAAINDAVKALRVSKFEYDGTEVNFIDKTGKGFGMWAPQEGSTCVQKDGKVEITIFPKNVTVYGWMHWGGTNEELTKDVALGEDGSILLTVDTDMCGWAHPIAPIKKSDGTTTGSQYYLAIPALSNITTAEEADAKAAIAAAKADLTNKELVEAALAAIEKLTDEQKAAMADDIQVINDAKVAINKTEAEAAIAAVKDDPTNKELVEAALAAIEKLTDEQKAEETMAAGIAAVNAAKTAIENKEAAEAAIAAAKADPTNKAKVQAALAAIDKLTDAQKAALADDIKAVNDAKTAIDKAEKEAAGQAEATKVKAMTITLKKAKAGKKKITVSWTKNTGVEGYEVYYKTGKKAKTVKITKNSITKKVIKKLKKGKKYTVKVRGYKKVNGQMVYTKWSKAKKAKVK